MVSQSYSNGNQMKTIDTFMTDESGEIMTVKPLRSAKYRIYEVDSANGLHIVKSSLKWKLTAKQIIMSPMWTRMDILMPLLQ